MQNMRGSFLMVLAMACFALEDALIKGLSAQLPSGQLMLFVGGGGLILFWALMLRRGQPLWTPVLLERAVLLRSVGEFIGALGFVSALTLADISSTTAILMVAPLATVLGAAIFLREPVGWRRWTAVAAGFIGVVLVVKPGTDGFQPPVLFAILGVAGLVLRDLITPRIRKDVSSLQISAAAYMAGICAGLVLLIVHRAGLHPPRPADWPLIAAMVGLGAAGYMSIVTATRIAELSAVIPLRYARLVFATIIGMTLFDEDLDPMKLTGTLIIVASGLYSIWREAQLRRRAASLARPGTL